MGFFTRKKERIAAPEPHVTQVPTLTKDQRSLLDQLTGRAGGILGNEFGGRATPFEGQLSAGASGLENLAFGSIEDLFAQGGLTQNFLQNALGGFNEQGSIDRFNEFQRPFAQANQAESQRQLLERLSGTGGFDSGATARAFAGAEGNFNLGLQSQLGQQLNFDEQLASQRQFGGLNALLGIQQQGLQGGGIQRGIEQGGLDRQYNEFLRQQGIDPFLGSILGQSLDTRAFENVITTPTTTFGPSTGSQFGSILSGIGSFF